MSWRGRGAKASGGALALQEPTPPALVSSGGVRSRPAAELCGCAVWPLLPLQACVWRILLRGLEAGQALLRHRCVAHAANAAPAPRWTAALQRAPAASASPTHLPIRPTPLPPRIMASFLEVSFPCLNPLLQARRLCSSWRRAPRTGSGGGAAWPGSTTTTSSGAQLKPLQ